MSLGGEIRRTALSLVSRHNPLKTVYSCFGRRSRRPLSHSPLVSFTFDDFLRSAFREGAPILEEEAARGTYYVALGLMGESGPLGPYFGEDDLIGVSEGGHEIGCHTYGHLDAWGTKGRAYLADVERNQRAVAELLPSLRLRNFAYPFGKLTFGLKRSLGGRFRSQRGVFRGINDGRIDLNLVLANRLYSSNVRMGEVERLIDRNASLGGWLVFYTHDVCEDPSAGGCTPGLLRSVVRRVARSGAAIVTVDRALTLLARDETTDQGVHSESGYDPS